MDAMQLWHDYQYKTFIISFLMLVGIFVKSHAVTHKQRMTILQLTSIFENSTPVLQYTFIANIHDHRGYTFGFPGFTSGTYDGTIFVKAYTRLKPHNRLAKYIPAFERIDAGHHDAQGRNPSIAGLEGFPHDFRLCGNDPVFRKAQRIVNNRLNWNPSQELSETIGARYAITKGQLYDACLNHGLDGAQRIVHKTNNELHGSPKTGVNERRWLAAFLKNRLDVLKADPTWRQAVDRVHVYQKLLSQGNVALARPMTVTCYGDTFTLQ